MDTHVTDSRGRHVNLYLLKSGSGLKRLACLQCAGDGVAYVTLPPRRIPGSTSNDGWAYEPDEERIACPECMGHGYVELEMCCRCLRVEPEEDKRYLEPRCPGGSQCYRLPSVWLDEV